MRAPHQVALTWSYPERDMGKSERTSRLAGSFFSMKINKNAIESLGIFILFTLMWDFIAIESYFSTSVSISNQDLLITIVMNLLFLYFITDNGFNKLTILFKKLTVFLKSGLKAIFWLVLILISIFLLIRFFSLPSTTLIIFLLLLILSKQE